MIEYSSSQCLYTVTVGGAALPSSVGVASLLAMQLLLRPALTHPSPWLHRDIVSQDGGRFLLINNKHTHPSNQSLNLIILPGGGGEGRGGGGKKFWVWLCWQGCWPPATHWHGPTTDQHGDSWLLGVPPGPVRPSLVNLIPPSSLERAMLMQALVWVTSRTPFCKPAHRTCLQLLDYRSSPRLPARGVGRK